MIKTADLKSIEELNCIVTPETGWRIELGISPHNQSEFLRLFRDDGVFITSLPRETKAGSIVAMGPVAKHYYKLGQEVIQQEKTS